MNKSNPLPYQELPAGQPLYFTVTATNDQGLSSHSTCTLPVFNLSPPGGRVSTDYATTSNPTILHGSVMAIDESPIITNKVSHYFLSHEIIALQVLHHLFIKQLYFLKGYSQIMCHCVPISG